MLQSKMGRAVTPQSPNSLLPATEHAPKSLPGLSFHIIRRDAGIEILDPLNNVIGYVNHYLG